MTASSEDARIPADFSRILASNEVDLPEVDVAGVPPGADTDLETELRQSLESARRWLEALVGGEAGAVISAKAGGHVLFTAPRIGLVRGLMFNHLYHHRGQLCLYLRLLNIPVPPVYGPTADENPFR